MVGKQQTDAAVGGVARPPLGVRMTAPGKYVAEIIDPSDNRRVCPGTFATEEKAVKAYRREVRRSRHAFLWKDFVKPPPESSSAGGNSMKPASEGKREEVGGKQTKVPFEFDLNLPAPLD